MSTKIAVFVQLSHINQMSSKLKLLMEKNSIPTNNKQTEVTGL